MDNNKSDKDTEWLYRILKPQDIYFDGLCYKPCRIELEESGEETVIPCSKEEATFWAIYITTAKDEEFTIIDCKTEEAAQEFIDWLIHMIKHFNPF